VSGTPAVQPRPARRLRARRVVVVTGVVTATLAAAGCGGHDREAYCAAVREVRQPAGLTGAEPSPDTVGPASPSASDDAALRTYLGQVRRLEELAPRGDEGQWRTLRQGLESVMTDGRLDVAKVETSQKQLTLMAQAADRLDGSLVGECGVGLSPG
jgi:hypothetical protein